MDRDYSILSGDYSSYQRSVREDRLIFSIQTLADDTVRYISGILIPDTCIVHMTPTDSLVVLEKQIREKNTYISEVYPELDSSYISEEIIR